MPHKWRFEFTVAPLVHIDPRLYWHYYSAPVEVRSIVINPSVCLSVCPRAYLWNRWTDLHEHLCADPYGRGSVFFWRRCDMLCTSGLMDDVTFRRHGRDAETWRLYRATTAISGVAIPGQSLMSTNACSQLWSVLESDVATIYKLHAVHCVGCFHLQNCYLTKRILIDWLIDWLTTNVG